MSPVAICQWKRFGNDSHPVPIIPSHPSSSFLQDTVPPLPSVRSSRSFSTSVPVIGILGGIGSGKSSVIRRVQGFRLLIVDADKIGHELLAAPEVTLQMRQTFGGGVFAENGRIDRHRVAKIVFGPTDQHKSALKQLEHILHPAIHQETRRQIISASHDVDAIIWDAALLLEAGWADECHALIFIDTPLEIRQHRVQVNRGWSADELAQREAAQYPIETKRAKADFVVDNSGDIQSAALQMSNFLSAIIQQHQQKQNQ